MTDPVRLAKRLASLVPCSRREAELYIAGGWVTVDGQVVEEPQFMVSEQKVALLPDGGCPEFCVNGDSLLLMHPIFELDGKSV